MCFSPVSSWEKGNFPNLLILLLYVAGHAILSEFSIVVLMKSVQEFGEGVIKEIGTAQDHCQVQAIYK